MHVAYYFKKKYVSVVFAEHNQLADKRTRLTTPIPNMYSVKTQPLITTNCIITSSPTRAGNLAIDGPILLI
jgi:hypothetical protein